MKAPQLTVSELIKELEQCPQDAKVYTSDLDARCIEELTADGVVLIDDPKGVHIG